MDFSLPGFVVRVAELVALARSVTLDEILSQHRKNVAATYGIPKAQT